MRRPRSGPSCGRPPAAAPSSRSATSPARPPSAALGDLVTREITWIGSYRFVEEIDDALRAMRDGLDVSPMISHRFALDRGRRGTRRRRRSGERQQQGHAAARLSYTTKPRTISRHSTSEGPASEDHRRPRGGQLAGPQLRHARHQVRDGVIGLGDATLNGRELAVASYLRDHVCARCSSAATPAASRTPGSTSTRAPTGAAAP